MMQIRKTGKLTCPRCNNKYWRRDFYVTRNSRTGLRTLDYVCKECRRASAADTYNRLRKKPDGVVLSPSGRVVSKNGSASRIYWGELRVRDFKRMYPVNFNEDLAIEFECSVRTIIRRAKEYGLAKDPAWLHSVQKANFATATFIRRITTIHAATSRSASHL